MKYTKNYNFKKPEPYDTRNINDINDSFDLVDAKLKETQDKNTNLDETFKQLIIDKGSNNAEIVAARRDKFNNKTYNSVPDRLDDFSSMLAQIENKKANKDTIFTMANMGQDIKEGMTGGSVAVVGVNSTGQINIIDNSLNRDKTKYYKIATNNLVDEKTMIYGGYYSPSSGKFVLNSDYKTTDVMKVNPGDMLKGNFYSLALYDINYNSVADSMQTNGVHTMPDGVAYVRANFLSTRTYHICARVRGNGTKVLIPPYEAVKYEDEQLVITGKNVGNDLLLYEQNLDIFDKVRTENLFDKTKITLGRWDENGVYAYTNTVTSDFIPATDGDVFRTKSYGYVTFYDSDKNFLKGIAPTNMFTIDSGLGIAYVRTTTLLTDVDTEMVVKNMLLPSSYTPYYRYTLKSKYLNKANSELSGKKLVVLSDSLSELAWGGVKKWHKIIAEKNNMILDDYSDGGTRIASTDRTTTEPDFVDRVDTLPMDGDIYIVFGGRNDIFANVPIGTIDSTDKTTLCGAVNIIITTILNKNPNAVIGFMTPLFARTEDLTKALEYSQAIINTCKRRAVPVLDLMTLSGIDPNNDAIWETLFLSNDIVHLNNSGQERISKKAENFIKGLT